MSYASCELVRSSDVRAHAGELTGALSGMNRSPRTSTSREAIAAAPLGIRGAWRVVKSRGFKITRRVYDC